MSMVSRTSPLLPPLFILSRSPPCISSPVRLLDMLQVLATLLRAKDMQVELETLVNEENFFKAFQVLSEYLQLLDSLSELFAIQEMSRGVEDPEAAEIQSTRLTYSDLCTRIPESEFRQCLLATLAALFKLMCSYYAIMSLITPALYTLPWWTKYEYVWRGNVEPEQLEEAAMRSSLIQQIVVFGQD